MASNPTLDDLVEALSSPEIKRSKVTVSMLETAENYLDHKIPETYRDYLLRYGNKVIERDMAVPHDGEKSSLVTWSKMCRDTDLSANYFPFCKSDQYFYCLERNKGTVHLWDSFNNDFDKEIWDTFMDWLKSLQ